MLDERSPWMFTTLTFVFSIYQVVWLQLFLFTTGKMIYAAAIVFAATIIGLLLGLRIIQSQRIREKYLGGPISTEFFLGLYGIVVISIFKFSLQLYITNFVMGLIVVFLTFTLHEILIAIAFWRGIQSYNIRYGLYGLGLGALATGLVILPYAGATPAIAFAMWLNLITAWRQKNQPSPVSLEGGLEFHPTKMLIGVAFTSLLLFWISAGIKYQTPTHAFSIVVFAMITGGVIANRLWALIEKRNADTLMAFLGLHIAFLLLASYFVFEGIMSIVIRRTFFQMPLGYTTFFLVQLPLWALIAAYIQFGISKQSGFYSLAVGGVIGAITFGPVSDLFGSRIVLVAIAIIVMVLSSWGLLVSRSLRIDFIVGFLLVLFLGLYLVTNLPAQYPTSISSQIAKNFAAYLPLLLGNGTNGRAFVLGDGISNSLAERYGYESVVSNSIFSQFSRIQYDVVILTEGQIHPKEFYEILKGRLTPDGVFAQYVPLKELSSEEFMAMVKTVQTVFPHTTLWMADKNGILVSSRRPLSIDYQRLAQRLATRENLIRDLEILYSNSSLRGLKAVDSVASMFFMSETEFIEYSQAGLISTLERPTQRLLLSRTAPKTALESLFEFKEGPEMRGVMTSVPPLINLFSWDNAELSLDFLKIKAELDREWEVLFAGLNVRYIRIEDTTDYGITYTKVGVLKKANTTIIFNTYEPRTLKDIKEGETEPLLERLLDREVFDTGAFTISQVRGYEIEGSERTELKDGNKGFIFYGGHGGQEVYVIALAWYCSVNKEIPVVSVDYVDVEEEPELFKIFEGIRCFA